ncbi:MAG TPA: hypothetical protein DC058_17720 [Planctomycetaceae bacterium]|nr:hypothetical protein [Planctomycetaceae bacterium]
MTATEVLREWFFARRINTIARSTHCSHRTPERQRSIATDGRGSGQFFSPRMNTDSHGCSTH